MMQVKVILWEELISLFCKYGDIVKIVVPPSKTHNNKGYAFITFSESKDVNNIFSKSNNLVLRAKKVI